MGFPQQAVDALHCSMRLSPRDPMYFRAQGAVAYAHFLLKDFDKAIAAGRRAIGSNPNYTLPYRAVASALAHARRVDEARRLITHLTVLIPDLSLSTLPELVVYKQSGGLDLILEGLRMAGVPE
jgi:adenylate cyclase